MAKNSPRGLPAENYNYLTNQIILFLQENTKFVTIFTKTSSFLRSVTYVTSSNISPQYPPYSIVSSKAAQAITFLTFIRQVPDSSLSRHTVYPDWYFPSFSATRHANTRIVP